MTIAGVVLVGGAGRRMGRPKHRMVVGDRELASRVADALAGAGCHPLIQVGAGDPVPGVPFVVDRWPGSGPVGGIITALAHLERQGENDGERIAEAVIAACDLPDLDRTTVELLLARPLPPAIGAIGSVAAGHHVPLTRWRLSSRQLLEDAFESGLRSWRGALELVGFDLVEVPASTTGDLDTPGDLARWSGSVDP